MCILSTIGALILTLQSARVQTAAVAILTDELSRALKVDAHIDRVEIRPPLAMNLFGVFLSDLQGDTLLSVPELKVRFNPFALENNRLSFPLVQIHQPTIHVVQDSIGTNLDFLLQTFPKNDNPQPFTYSIDCRKIAIQDARVHYIHRPSNMDVILTDLCTDVGFTYAGKDQMQAQVRQVHVKAKMQPVHGYLEANLHGSLDTLYMDQLQVMYRGHQILDGNVCAYHLLKKDSLYAKFSCTDLNANSSVIASLISDITHQPVQLPAALDQLGTIHYRGDVEGRPNDLQLCGAFRTRIGSISTDVCVKNMKEAKGRIRTSNLALNRWLSDSPLGRVSASVSFDGDLYDSIPSLKANGVVSRLDFKGYSYSNIRFHADLSQKEELTSLSIDDPNLQLQFVSHLNNWTTKAPSLYMDVQVPELNLAALHLTDSTLGHWVKFSSTIALKVDSTIPNIIDGTLGSITIDSLYVRGAGHELQIPQVRMIVDADSSERHMSIVSPVLTANIDGHFQFSTIPATIYGFIHRNIPSLIPSIDGHDYTNDMNFSAELLQADAILNVIGKHHLHFPTVPQLTGFVHESDSSFQIRLFSDKVIKKNTAYQNMVLALDNNNPERNATGSFYIQQHIIQQDSTRLRIDDLMASIQFIAHHDSITTAVEFGSVNKADSVPDILVHTTFGQMKNQPWVDVHFMPSDFQVGRAQWHIDDSHVNFIAADTLLTVNNLHVHTPQQMLMVDGRMSKHTSDSLRIQVQDLDLGYLLSATKVLDAIDFSGNISGWATLYGAFSYPQFEANLSVQDATINHVPLGYVTAKAELDHANQEVVVSGSAIHDNVHLADVQGRVIPSKKHWDLFVDANGVPLNFIDYWTENIVDDIAGFAYGRVHIFGRNMRTWVTTRAYAKDAAVTVPATGARYYFSDSIVMDTTYIDFPAIHLKDAQGHEGSLSGRINHTNFQHFNFQLSAQCNNLLAIDLPASATNVYYGQAFATGTVGLSGNDFQTNIDVHASTSANTDFFLSLATASNASSSEFITFKQPVVLAADSSEQDVVVKRQSHLFLNLAIDVTPQAKVHLVLNEHNGDGIIGRGEGNIHLGMDASTGEMKILGTYTLMNGTFSYSVANLIHRDFSIAEGSKIIWSGDAANPKLDITAKYRCTASLRDLFGADVKQVTSRSSIPVDCVIYITGTLNDMILKFGIEYPQSDESVSAQINAIINTEAMLMRQVVYLLVFNRFYTPDNMRTSTTGLNDAYSLLSSTVTGQINSWLSKLTDMVNVGFNVRANVEQGNQSYETEANIQIQPVDRLTINGNVGYRYNDISNQPFYGDADVEYELTPDGKFRAKVFTHSVDKYSLHQAGMQTGVGFIFRHDFNPGDAKKRREQKKAEASK